MPYLKASTTLSVKGVAKEYNGMTTGTLVVLGNEEEIEKAKLSPGWYITVYHIFRAVIDFYIKTIWDGDVKKINDEILGLANAIKRDTIVSRIAQPEKEILQ